MVILDTSDAAGLNPVGRLIYFQGSSKIEMQGPLITPAMVDDKVEGIATGEAVATLERSKKHNLTPHDLFRHALNKYRGQFTVAKIWNDLKAEGLSRPEVQKIGQRFEGREIEIDGSVYVLDPPSKHTGALYTPRTLRLIEEQSGDEEIPNSKLDITPDTPSTVGDEIQSTPAEESPAIPELISNDDRELFETAEPTDSADGEPDEFDEFAERINEQFGIKQDDV
jgi:hypothetical protein